MRHEFSRSLPLTLSIVISLLVGGSAGARDASLPAQDNAPREPLLALEPRSLHMVNRKAGWARNTRTHLMSNELFFNFPALLRTTDGGRSWRRTLVAGTNDLISEYVCDAQTAWAVVVHNYETVTNRVAVFHTRDGGQNWTRHELPQSEPIEFACLSFPDSTTGWVMLIPDHGMNSSPGVLYRTDTGGASWQLVNRVDQRDGDPEDALCRLAGQSVPLTNPPYGGDIYFQNSGKGWLCGAATTTTPSFVSVTEDGGRTWRVLGLSVPGLTDGRTESVEMPGFFPKGGKHGILCARCSCPGHDDCYGLVYSTRDGGSNWRSTPPLKGRGEFYFISEKQGWFWGDDPDGPGALFRTDDGGHSWKRVGPENDVKRLVRQKRIRQLDFVDRQFGWTLAEDNGARTAFLQTRDGGKRWEEIQPTFAP